MTNAETATEHRTRDTPHAVSGPSNGASGQAPRFLRTLVQGLHAGWSTDQLIESALTSLHEALPGVGLLFARNTNASALDTTFEVVSSRQPAGVRSSSGSLLRAPSAPLADGPRGDLDIPVRHAEEVFGVLRLEGALGPASGVSAYVGANLEIVAELLAIGFQREREAVAKRLAEDQLLRATEELLATTEGFPDLFIRHDSTGLFLECRARTGFEVLGVVGPCAGKSLGEVFPEPVASLFEKVLTRCLEERRMQTFEYLAGPPGGEIRAFETRLVPLLSRQALSITRDISERKAAEKALQALEKEFRHSQKMEAVGRLTGGIAHDFNNLVTTMLGHCHFLAAEIPTADPLAWHVSEIAKAGERVVDLTRQLLSFSRKRDVARLEIDLNVVVRDLEKMLRQLIGEDIGFALETEPGLFSITQDAGQIQQVLMNLVINARDAMPRGGRLVVRTARTSIGPSFEAPNPGAGASPGRATLVEGLYEATRGDYAVLSVIDTGTGMDAETRANLFRPYYTTKGLLGTGLGLSTVAEIVKEGQGFIVVETEPGRGSSFHVHFPAHDTGTRIPARPTEAKAAAATTDRIANPDLPRGTETILLVEDETAVRTMTADVLRRSGYRVFEAAHGAEGLTEGRQRLHEIDLLVTDVVMPEMSGPELAGNLSRLRPDLRVLFISGYTDQPMLSGLSGRGLGFLQKPFTPQVVSRRVRELLDGVG